MSAPEESIAQLEDQLEGASRMLSRLHALNARQAERVVLDEMGPADGEG